MIEATKTESRLVDRPNGWRESISRWHRGLSAEEGLTFPWLIVAFLVACVLLILREPSLFTHPQFWAEDGRDWYAQAYNSGWLHSLTIPDGGYLNTLQRIGAGLALLVPFRLAPLVMALVGLIVQALPVPILLSYRCSRWSPLSVRIAFALAYLAIPNAHEIHVICTNSHFHLAVIEVLLAFSLAPRSVWGRCFDIFIFLLAGVSGPFAIMLMPLLAIFWWIRRQRWSVIQLIAVACTSIPQIYMLTSASAARHDRALGATWSGLVRLLGGNCYLGVLRGTALYGTFYPLVICLGALIVCVTLMLYCARSASLEVRLFFIYSYIVLAAELRSPLAADPPIIPWVLLLHQPALRYWFFPSLPLLFAIMWSLWLARSRVMRWTAAILFLSLCQAVARDWRNPPMRDLNFPYYAAVFERAPHGANVVIPINPNWEMALIKK